MTEHKHNFIIKMELDESDKLCSECSITHHEWTGMLTENKRMLNETEKIVKRNLKIGGSLQNWKTILSSWRHNPNLFINSVKKQENDIINELDSLRLKENDKNGN